MEIGGAIRFITKIVIVYYKIDIVDFSGAVSIRFMKIIEIEIDKIEDFS